MVKTFLKNLVNYLTSILTEGSEDDKGEGQDGKDKNGNNVSKGKSNIQKKNLIELKMK